jgi:hypothetical protein
MPYLKDCPLCVLEKKTEWYFENDVWVILDCTVCHRPVVILKKHHMPSSDPEGRNFAKWLERRAWELAQQVFEPMGLTISYLGANHGTVKDHWHRHIYFVGDKDGTE